MKILLKILAELWKFKFIILLFFVFILIFVKIKFHVKIKWRTFFHKGINAKRGNFGIYCYEAPQGNGKTLSLVEYLIDNKDNSVIFSNIGGIKNLNYTHYVGFNGLIEIKNKLDNGELIIPKNKQLVIVYDEIFTELQRGSKVDKEVLDFLCQMRKRKIIFLTTAQYWAEIPITFRRFCRYQISPRIYTIFGTSFMLKLFYDAENMKWSNDEQDFIAPLVDCNFSKIRKSIANSYDTYLRISSVVDFSKKS